MRVSGIEQRISPDEVAVIDFTGGTIPAAETARIQDGRALVVLRSGDTFYGRLYDIGGNDPLRITFRTQPTVIATSARRRPRASTSRGGRACRRPGSPGRGSRRGQPGRGHCGSSGLGPAGHGTPGFHRDRASGRQSGAGQGGTFVTIPANRCWIGSGIQVWRGQIVAFDGTGEIQLSDDSNDTAGVAGSMLGRYAQNGPMRRLLAGALLGRVEGGRPFGIGNQRQGLTMPGDGELYLGVNDDSCGDNRGEFTVQIIMDRR